MVDDIGIVAVRPLAVKGDGYSLPPDAHEPACEMKRLYVKPGHQGLGIGKALVQEALANARALGYRFIALDTLERLAAANAMYEKAGFTRIPRYYASLPDAVFWGRPL